MTELTFEKIWDAQPKAVRAMPSDSKMRQYYESVFQVFLEDRAIPKIDFLRANLWLDSASGTGLDEIALDENIVRGALSDEELKEVVRFRRILRDYGLTENAIKLYIQFKTGLEVKLFDEYQATHPKYPHFSNVIFSPTGLFSRGYIRFWNVPPLSTTLLNFLVRQEIQPFVKAGLLPYKSKEAIEKVVAYFCSSFSVTLAREDSTVIHSTHESISRSTNRMKIERSSWDRNPVGITLHSPCAVSIEDLQKELQARVLSYDFYIKLSSLSAYLNHFVTGVWTDITAQIKPDNTYIWPKNFDFLFLDVTGMIRIDTPVLERQIEVIWGYKCRIRDPLRKKLTEIMSVPYHVIWGSEVDSTYIVPDNVSDYIYIFYSGNIDEISVRAEIEAILPDKTFRFIQQ